MSIARHQKNTRLAMKLVSMAFMFATIWMLCASPALAMTPLPAPSSTAHDVRAVAGDPAHGGGDAVDGSALNYWEHIVSSIPSWVGRSQAAVDQYCREQWAVIAYKAMRSNQPYVYMNGWMVPVRSVNWVWGHASMRVCVLNW